MADEITISEDEKSNRMVKCAVDTATQSIKFTVRDVGEIVFHADKAHSDNRVYAEFHGWKQRLVDDAAGEKTALGKFNAIKGLCDYYETGAQAWKLKGEKRELTVEEKTALFNKLKAELNL